MDSKRSLWVLLAATSLAAAIWGCAQPPGELYEDVGIKEIIEGQPGLYELHSSVAHPIHVQTEGEHFVVLRQSKDMIIAAGDSLEQILNQYAGQDFSLVGRRMGEPKLWFAVDGVVQQDKLVRKVAHNVNPVFPSYESFDPGTADEYETTNLAEYDFDKERALRPLLDKKIRIHGNLSVHDLGDGAVQYIVESRNLKVELSPVGKNMQYFLDMARDTGVPFVGYGELTSIRPWDDGSDNDRESSQVIGSFKPELYRYNRDIVVRNVL